MTDQTANVIRIDDHREEPKPQRHRAERIALTTKRVEDAKPTSSIDADGNPVLKRRRIADKTVVGMFLVVQPSGAKSYVARGRIGKGRTRPMIDYTIGSTDAVSLSDARKEAQRVLGLMRAGIDPRQKNENGEASVADVLEGFLGYHRKRRTRSIDKIERSLRRVTLNVGQQPAHMVSKARWSQAVDRVYEKHGLSAAQSSAQWLRGMAKWADETGLAENMPARKVVSPSLSDTETNALNAKRAASLWTLRSTDWRKFWDGTSELANDTWTAYLRAVALTGLRRGEASLARWSHTDLDTKTWTVPGSNTKSGRDHWVHIGPLLEQVLTELPRSHELLFPGRNGRVMSGWSKRIPKTQKVTGLPLQLHGLRRGYRTALAELGVSQDVAERMIAHVPPDLVTRYDVSGLENLRREAQERLEAAWMEVVL